MSWAALEQSLGCRIWLTNDKERLINSGFYMARMPYYLGPRPLMIMLKYLGPVRFIKLCTCMGQTAGKRGYGAAKPAKISGELD